MIDFHSHILPHMDDGSSSVEESLAMLRESARQNIDVIVATPHFYAMQESLEDFLLRRKESFGLLEKALGADMPKVLLGAEVLYFPGMSQTEGIRELAINGGNLMLIEMPFSPWSSGIISELHHMETRLGIKVVLAHIERYQRAQDKRLFKSVINNDFLIQCNASAFSAFSSRRLAMDLFYSGNLHFLGSDCHNMTTRRPNMDDAFTYINKKTETGSLDCFNSVSGQLLSLGATL